MELKKIAFGGGCHWCTEAIFQSLKGVEKVLQGFVASEEKSSFSEAVIVYYNKEIIHLKLLIEVHLHTHKSTKNHSMREKYRSAMYCFSNNQKEESFKILKEIQETFNEEIITKILKFKDFKISAEEFQNYYQKNPEKPFCKKYIHPKLKIILNEFSQYSKPTNSF